MAEQGSVGLKVSRVSHRASFHHWPRQGARPRGDLIGNSHYSFYSLHLDVSSSIGIETRMGVVLSEAE